MNRPIATLLFSLAACLNASCVDEPTGPSKETVKEKQPTAKEENKKPSAEAKLETATLGAGCYWCVEAVLVGVGLLAGLARYGQLLDLAC